MVLAVVAYLHGRHLPVRRSWLLLTVVATPGPFLSEGTVKYQVSAILLRLGLHNRVQAAIIASGDI